MGGPATRVRGPAGPAARDATLPLSGDPHARPRRGPRGAVRARARLALLGRPLSGHAAPLPARRRGRVRHDGLVTTGPGARAAGAVLPAPRTSGAGRGAAAGQAGFPGRAGGADPRAARTRLERRRDRACPSWERCLVAAVDGRGLLQAKLRAGVPLAPLTPVEILPRRREHLRLRLGERTLERCPRRLAVSAPAEAMRQLRHVHVAERAGADLHLAVRQLA